MPDVTWWGHSTCTIDDRGVRVAAGARVHRAMEILGEDAPEHLLAAGRLRLEHRQASLEELLRAYPESAYSAAARKRLADLH